LDNGVVFEFGGNHLALYADTPAAASWAVATLPPFMPLSALPASRHVIARFHDDRSPSIGDELWTESQPLFLGRKAVGRSGDGWRELNDTAAQIRYSVDVDGIDCWYGQSSRFILHEPARLVREILVGRACRAGWCRLHAGAVEVDGRVALVLGCAGAGKSSTVAQLVAAGASFVANDRLVAMGGSSPRVVGLPVAVRWSEVQLGLFAGGRDWIDHHAERSSLRRSDDRAGYMKYELTVPEVAALAASPTVPGGRLTTIVVVDRRVDCVGSVVRPLAAVDCRSELWKCLLGEDPAFPAFYDLEPPDKFVSEQAFSRLSASVSGLPSLRFRARFDDTSAVEGLLAEIAQSPSQPTI